MERTFIGSSYWFGLKTSKVQRRQSELFRKSPVKLISLLDIARKDSCSIKGDGSNVIAYQMLSCNAVEKLPTVVDYLHEGVKTASVINERRLSDCKKSCSHLHNIRLGDLSADDTCNTKTSLLLEKSSMTSSKLSFSFGQHTALFSCDETKLEVCDDSDTTTNDLCDGNNSRLTTLHNVCNDTITDKPQHRMSKCSSNSMSINQQCADINSKSFQVSNCDFTSSFNDSSLLLACNRDGISLKKQPCEDTKNWSTEIRSTSPFIKRILVELTDCNGVMTDQNLSNQDVRLLFKNDLANCSFTDIRDNISNKSRLSSYDNNCELGQYMPVSEDMDTFFENISFNEDHDSARERTNKNCGGTVKLLSITEMEHDALWEHLPESEDFDDFLAKFDTKMDHNQMSAIAEDIKTTYDNSAEIINSNYVCKSIIKDDECGHPRLHPVSLSNEVSNISNKTCTNNNCMPSNSIPFNESCEVTNRNINVDDETVNNNPYEANNDASIISTENNESCVDDHFPALPESDIQTMEANEDHKGIQTYTKLTKDREHSINSSSDLFDSYTSSSDIHVGSGSAKEWIDSTVDVVDESVMERFSTPLYVNSGSRKRKGVKFAQRLSIVSSIQVIDIRMKLNKSSMMDCCAKKLLPKPCLKRLSEVTDDLCESGSPDLFSPCPIATIPSKVIILSSKPDEHKGLVNSDTLPDVELLRDSEDLFSQDGYIPFVLSSLSCSSRMSQEISLSSQDSFIIPPSTNKKNPQCKLRVFSSYNPNIFKIEVESFRNHVNSELTCASPDLFACSPDLFSPCTPHEIPTNESHVKCSNINLNTSIFISTPNLYLQSSEHILHSVIKQSISKDQSYLRNCSNCEHSVLGQIYTVSPDIFSPLVDETPLCAKKRRDVFLCKKLFTEDLVSD